jgi:hypothetical protein
MARRKAKPRKGGSTTKLIIGIGWYDHGEWTKLKQVAADSENIDDTFEDWLRSAERTESGVGSDGDFFANT